MSGTKFVVLELRPIAEAPQNAHRIQVTWLGDDPVFGRLSRIAAVESCDGKFIEEVIDPRGSWKHEITPNFWVPKIPALGDALDHDPRIPQPFQPIETAPKDGTKVLIWSKEGGIEIGWFMHGEDVERWIEDSKEYSDVVWSPIWTTDAAECYNGEFGSLRDGMRNQPTHWMPLPEAPTA